MSFFIIKTKKLRIKSHKIKFSGIILKCYKLYIDLNFNHLFLWVIFCDLDDTIIS